MFWLGAKIFPYKNKWNEAVGSIVLIKDKSKEEHTQDDLKYAKRIQSIFDDPFIVGDLLLRLDEGLSYQEFYFSKPLHREVFREKFLY